MKLKNIVLATLLIVGCGLYAQDTPNRFRMAINAGPSFRISKIDNSVPEPIKSYIRELKSGFTIDIEADYMVDPAWGLGIQYSRFNSKGSTIANFVAVDGTPFTAPTSDNITLTYFGPQYLTVNKSNDGRHCLIGSASLGYLGYKNKSTIGLSPITFEGATIGYGIGIGYQYRIADFIGIGAKIGVIGGSIAKFDITENGRTRTLTVEEVSGLDREGLTRVDVTGGIRFYL